MDDDQSNDIHDTPATSSTDRMHEMDRNCWCKPMFKDRKGVPGRIVIHHGMASFTAEQADIINKTGA